MSLLGLEAIGPECERFMAETVLPLIYTAIPDVQLVLNEAKALIDDIQNWPNGKTYHGVQTSKRSAGAGPSWFSRTR